MISSNVIQLNEDTEMNNVPSWGLWLVFQMQGYAQHFVLEVHVYVKTI